MIEYRPATIDDVIGVQQVLATTWPDTYPNLQPETIKQVAAKWHSIAFLTQQIMNEKFFFPVALDGAEVVGIATSGMRQAGVVDLFRLYVLPAYQSQGIGSTFLRMVEGQYPDATKIQVYVEINNESGIAYYERQGFKKISQETEESFGEIITDWLMEKVL